MTVLIGDRDEEVLSGASRAIAREVLVHGPQPRTELAQRLNLSAGSLSRLTKPLIESGLLAEGPAVRGSSVQGPPVRPVEVVATARHLIGVKLTGTEAFAVLIDLRAQILDRRHALLPSRDPAAVCTLVGQMVRELTPAAGRVSGLGVGFGGHSPNRVEVFAPFLGWENVPLATMLRDTTGLPSVVDNDVIALTESQHWFGAGRGHDRFAVITTGAGIGYALVMHDRIARSLEADIGVFGHFIIDRHGPICPEGHRGCASAYLRTEAVVAAASVALCRPVSYDEALDLAAGGDLVARMVVDDAGLALGRLVAAVADLAMATHVILAGEGVRLAVVAATAVRAGLTESRPAWADPVVLDVQQFGFDEWARGAAVIAMQSFVIGRD